MTDANLGQLRQGNLPAACPRHQHSSQCIGIAAEIAIIADIDRISFQSLDRFGHRHAAHRSLDDLLNGADVDAVAGRLDAIDSDVEVVAAHGPLGRWR